MTRCLSTAPTEQAKDFQFQFNEAELNQLWEETDTERESNVMVRDTRQAEVTENKELPLEEPVTVVCQLTLGSMCNIPVEVHGKNIQAVVDTAAEVTIMSDTMFRQLEVQPCIKRTVTLRAAGRDMSLKGEVVGPVEILHFGKIYMWLQSQMIYCWV